MRGDEHEDAWSALAATTTVKLFLAFAAHSKLRVKQADFVAAYLSGEFDRFATRSITT